MAGNKKGPKAYVVDFEADVNGTQKYVAFHEGTGVLSEAQILASRPEWQDPNAPGRLQIKDGVRALMGEYVRYWKDKGATVSEIPVAKAAALANKLAAAAKKRREREAAGAIPKPKPIVVAGTTVGHEAPEGSEPDADDTEPRAPHEGDDEPDAPESDDEPQPDASEG